MNQNNNHILTKGQVIDDKYTVTFFLKKGSYAETYRVKDKQKTTKLLKLFSYSKLHRTQFDQNGDVLEIEILKKLNHPNIVKLSDSGELLIENQKYAYAILDFISGETLADKMKREQTFNPYEAKDIILGVLNGLNYLHNQQNPIIHNDITNLNVMLDLSGQVSVPKIIDFGYARFLSQSHKDFQKDGLNPFYTANETFNKVFSVQSDIFSVGALYYHLLVGLPPWFVELSKFKSDSVKLEDAILKEREKPFTSC
jgi:transitional endoplasmic reticulum ATPase